MVKKDNKDVAKKSNKSSNKKNSKEVIEAPPTRTKQNKTGKKKQVKEIDEEYDLPNPSFECPDENVEQALSASFIEVYEKTQKEDSVNLTDKPIKKEVAGKDSQKKSKSQGKSSENKAVKRKQNKENDDSDAKKQKPRETAKSTGKKRKQTETIEVTASATEGEGKTRLQKKLSNIKVEAGSIKVEAGTVNDAGAVKPQQRGATKKRKVSKVETEESQTNKPESDDNKSQTEGHIMLSVGNMPSGCNREALNFFFNESDLYPQIRLKKKSVTIESEKGEKHRRNVIKGFATLICKSQVEADAILKLDGETMTSVTGEESEITISLKQSADPIESATKLFVGALHPKIPEAELQEALEDEGISVLKVKRACWKGGKRPKSYGFVWLTTPEDVAKAVAAEIMIEGKQIVITHCKA